MGFLYVISEGDNDDLFYWKCVERLTNRKLDLVPRRSRKGGGIGAARRALPVLLDELSRIGPVDDTFFVATLDNDRCRAHPRHESQLDPNKATGLPKGERDKPCRFCELLRLVRRRLGEDGSWPINGAIGVPVEMLESWLLLTSNPTAFQQESSLPFFARRNNRLAKLYFAPRHPPDQLKDLKEKEMARLGLKTTGEYCEHCARELDPDDLATRSPSFALFRDQVLAWTAPSVE